jgi:hypothetical protein
MEKELTDLFIEKRYHELSDGEKEQVNELCASEEEFEQMRHVFLGVQLLKNEQFQAKHETKESLDGLFAAVHAPQKKVFWMHSAWLLIYPEDKAFVRKPLVQMAAVALVMLLTVPFLNREKLVDEPLYTSKVEKITRSNSTKTDTTEPTNTAVRPGTQTDSRIPAIPTPAGVVDASDLTASYRIGELSAERIETSSVLLDFDHPDGEFKGVTATFSCSAQQQPDVFDLITAAF